MRRSAAHKALFIVAAMAGIFGYTFSEANQTQLLELITAGAVGSIVALIGGIHASKDISA